MSKKILVVIDPGHKPKYNRGAAPGYYEGDKMYALSEYEKTALEAYGVDVILTRKRENDMDLYARGQVAVKNGAGYDAVVFLSNHSNGFDGTAVGVVAYRSAHLPDSAALGKKLVNAVVGVMRPVTGVTYSRGVATRQRADGADYYGVIRGSVSGAKSEAQAAKVPVKYSFIVEHGFHDNKTECAFLNEDANLKALAEAEAKAIADYFGLTVVKKPAATSPASHRVKITADVLNVRKGAGTNYQVVTTVKKNEVYTIVDESNGWGKLKSGVGWIKLSYTKRV